MFILSFSRQSFDCVFYVSLQPETRALQSISLSQSLLFQNQIVSETEIRELTRVERQLNRFFDCNMIFAIYNYYDDCYLYGKNH